MKEFSFKIGDKALNGLRAHHTNPRNSGGLVDCMNILPTDSGLLSYEAATPLFEDAYLFDLIPPVEWPFPQMHFGPVWTLLCFQTKIYSIDRSLDPWNPTLVYDFGTQSTWDEDNTWHIADFYDMVVLTNGLTMLWYDPYNAVWTALTGSSTIPVMGTICNYRGQLVGGNFITSWYDTDSSFVGWGKIGSFSMLPDESNIAGYKPMDFTGSIRRMLPLGKAIITYGEGGIAALIPGDTTFGSKKLASFGIMSRDAIYGDEDRHIFIDENGWLNQLTADLKLTRLGYQEFFQPMSAEYPIIVNDSSERRYYIGDGTDTFVLTPAGLGKGCQMMTSGAFIEGVFVANIVRDDTPNLTYQITTDTFDVNYRAQKTIEAIDVGSDQSDDCYVSIDYRFKKTESWTTTREVRCNDEGVAHLPCAGIEFRFNLRFVDYIDVNLDYLNIKYKATDRRFTRGTTHAIANAS